MAEREYNKLFVGGDLSGIQKFLYNITSRHASVSLKGRSAFLSKYLRDVCNIIEDTIEGYGKAFDELYCSGGKFYLITDNTPSVCEAIDNCAKAVKEELWNEHRGQLAINISHVAYKEQNGKYHVEGHEEEQNTSSGVLWKYCNADFARQKNQKFKELVLSRPNKFFGFKLTNEDGTDNEDCQDLIVGEGHKVCALTGVEFDITKLPKGAKYTIDDDKDLFYLPAAIKQIEEGKKLSEKKGLKTFEQYADGSYLGVLRMDVDGMGKRFIIGFDSLDKYKEFSGKVTTFFEGKVIKNELGKTIKIPSVIDILLEKPVTSDSESPKFKEYLNVIYAGGDDLFIIGRWDRLIEFAKKIHDALTCPVEEFLKSEYNFERTYIDTSDSNKEKHISISGGIAIVKPKFPIAKAADMAGEAEEAAKDYREEKNTFNLFGKTVTWESEFDEVERYKNDFIRIIRDVNEGKGKSLLHKLMLYGEIVYKNEQPGIQPNYRYIWHSAYYLKRYQDRYKHDEVKTLCEKLSKSIASHRTMQLISIAARWAELQLR